MIRIQQIRLPVEHTEEQLLQAVKKALSLRHTSPQIEERLHQYVIVRQSIDARDKGNLRYIYTIDVPLPEENRILRECRNKNITIASRQKYQAPTGKPEQLPPIIVGTGPAGLFCGLLLARAGWKPVLIERGQAIEDRVKTVEEFWKTGILKEDSNVQFGEGGAGTFSDGKLNTGVKDKRGRNRFVLETFVEYGAPEEILYQNKPHIGTDRLRSIIPNMRQAILNAGGQIRFETKLTDLMIEKGRIVGIEVNGRERLPCRKLILALGHSARDTFSMLYHKGIPMSRKPFAIGLRAEHPAAMIHQAQYGTGMAAKLLPPADYKLVHHCKNGRGVYSFCMCPGGFVVNASSEQGYLAVNGMSNYGRNAPNSNSAIVVTVGPDDFPGSDPLAGMEFQRYWEERAYQAGNGQIPIQLLEDMKMHRPSKGLGEILPCCKGAYTLTDLHGCLPKAVMEGILEGMAAFGRKIEGFDRPDTLLSGVETRTSSPVRILRKENLQCSIDGVYPCGEGAGYAGGITSAAMDGIRAAEAVMAGEERRGQ